VLNPGDLVALNPPSPGGRELRNPPEPKVNGDQKKAAASQSSTTPTVPSHASQVGRYSQQNTSQGNENAPPDWWLDWFTAGLVIVGLFQLVVFGYQAKKLRESIDLTREISGRQERDMRDSIAEAARAAVAMRDAADAARESAEAAKLQAQALLGVEIPHLEITSIELIRLGAPHPRSNDPTSNGSGMCKKYGRTPAFTRQQAAEFSAGLVLPTKPEYESAHDLASGHVIDPNAKYYLPLVRVRDLQSDQMVSDIINLRTFLWIYGYIFYRDFLNEPHMLHFCARLYIPTGRAVGNVEPQFTIGSCPQAYEECY
jgi:guanyl-specific ribonuclease Sa